MRVAFVLLYIFYQLYFEVFTYQHQWAKAARPVKVGMCIGVVISVVALAVAASLLP